MKCNAELYDFYIEEFSGNLQPEVFKKAIINAQAFLRYITLGRSEKCLDSVNVKLCLCAVADTWAEVFSCSDSEDTSKKQVRSETTDGYSVTYASEFNDATTNERAFKIKALEVAKTYLYGTGLLDRRVRGGCCDY